MEHSEAESGKVDSTYFTATDVEPDIKTREDGTPFVQFYSGQGSRRSWGRPQCTNYILFDDCDLLVSLTGFSHKHRGGQFYRYFVKIDGRIERRTWTQLTEDEQALVLKAYDENAPSWARTPGKLKSERKAASTETFTAYKIFRYVDAEHYQSLYDATEWRLGRRNAQAAKPEHDGGYYVHESAERIMALWRSGDLVPARCYTAGEYALVKCECAGNTVHYSSGKIGVTYCRPVELVEMFTYGETATA